MSRRPLLLALLMAWPLLAAPATAESPSTEPSPADAPPAAWAAVRFAETGWQLFDALEVAAESVRPDAGEDEAVAAWVWSSVQPPRSVEAPAWRSELAALRTAPPPGSPLTAYLTEPCAPRCADLWVIAAPRAMWEQVEETWLPRWPVADDGRVTLPRDAGEAWRVRLIGEGRGGWWQDVGTGQASVQLVRSPALDLPLDVRDPEGGTVDFVFTLMVDEPSGERPEVLARYVGRQEAPTGVRALPVDRRAVFLTMAEGYPTWALAGRGEDLPRPVRLPAGGRIDGRFVDADGQPVAGVEVAAEGWVSTRVPMTTLRTATSDETGAWSLGALASGEVVLEAGKEGLRTFREKVEVRAGDLVDLGTLVLEPGVGARVEVRAADGAPVVGAVVRRLGSRSRSTGRDGVARLEGLAPGERLKLRVEAPGFLPAEATLSPPWPDPAVVTLERGLTVTGVYADASGVPVADGNVRIETGSSFRDDSLDPGGGFELLLEPTVDHVLVLASPHTPESRVRVPAGQAGEHRDLGPILAAPGLVAYGRIVSAADGLPLGGARIWTPRVRRHGAVAAWAFGDVVEATSDTTGDFAVTGLDRRVHELVVEVPGHARRYVEVRPEEGEDAVDLGNVEISPGATVAVDVDPDLGEAADRLEARLDLRGDWRDLDMLFAPVVDGRAEFVHVPAGRSLLTVRVGHEIVCERSVVVTDEEPVEVACDRARDDVAGQVWVGDQLASRGVLTWRPPPAGDAGAVIFNRSSPRGARQQRAVGVGRLPVVVEVVDDGSFRSDRLVAGRWQVSWQADGGEPFVPLTVDVPTGGVAGLDLRFDGVVVSGWVLDEDEEPVAGAVVGEVGGGATVLSGEDGGFRLAGLDAGSLSLQARWRDRYSEVAEVVVEADRPPQPVELRVRRRHGGLVPVEIWTAAGAPARGAFVFFEADPGVSTRVVSADLDGRAELAYPEPVPERVRVAVHVDGRWVLGDWVALDEATDGLVLEVPATGDLALSIAADGGPATLVSDRGWDLARLLTLLGSRPRVDADRPLVVRGLPLGLYTVGLGDRLHTARVERDRETEVELE